MLSYNMFIAIYITTTIVTIISSFTNISLRIPGISKEKKNTLSLIFLSLIIAILASLRPDTIPDFHSYENTYLLKYSFSDFASVAHKYSARIAGMEILFVAIVGLLKSAGLTLRQEFFVFAFVNAVLILCMSKKLVMLYVNSEPNVKHIKAIFLSLFGYHYCCIAIRSGLGIGLGLLAIVLLLEGNIFKKIIGTLIFAFACLIHSMSVMMIVPLVILLIKNEMLVASRKWVIATGTICVLSLALNIGSLIIRKIINIFILLTTRFSIGGYWGYVYNFDLNVGKRDLLIVVSTLIVLLFFFKTCNCATEKLMLIVSLGLIIIAFLYPVRAINRAADYFFVFLIPLRATVNIKALERKRIPYILGVSDLMYLLYTITL